LPRWLSLFSQPSLTTCKHYCGIRQPSDSSIAFFGLARTLGTQFPFLFGEARLREFTADEVRAQTPRDHWESEGLVDIPLEPNAILDFVREVYRGMNEHQITHSATYAGLFSILASLRYEYPDDWEAFVRELEEVEVRK